MPKHSRSRSPKDKKSHKHKDKKKHRKSSRSRSREKKYDRRSPKENKYGNQESRRDYNDERNKFDMPRERSRDSRREETKQDRFQDSSHSYGSPQKPKSNRFSDKRISNFSQLILANQQSTQQQQQEFKMPQNQTNQPSNSNGAQQRHRKKKNVWTDADEDEIREQMMFEKKQSLDESHPALMIGSNQSLLSNLNPAILNALQDSSKIKKKIYLPKNTGINYIGLLIGPRGLYQKRLEEESGCKILIRGKGSQKEGSAPQPDDDDEQHVLIIGDSPEMVRRAQNAIERVISADDSTRNKIREEQLVVAQQINNKIQPNQPMDDSMMTPYGPPSPYAYIIPVPNDCVGLIIGKGGDTIRQLQMESGAKIQVAKKEIPDSNLRNVFVEGPPERYTKAKEMIEEIIREHRRTADPQVHVGDYNPFPGQHQKIKVPDKFVGLIIGKNGDTLKGIAQRSNTKIFVPQKNIEGAEERTVEVDGDPHCVEIARQEIISLIQRYMSQSSTSAIDYGKNPYGSGIAVYQQSKMANEGQNINGAVPDSMKPDSGVYASSLLTSNPLIAYELTGWSYEDPHAPAQPNQPQCKYNLLQQILEEENQQANPEGQAAAEGQQNAYYDQQYQQYYGQYPQNYDYQQYQDYYNQYYQQYPPPGTDNAQANQGEGQPNSTDGGGEEGQKGNNDYSQQQYQEYYNQWNQYYYGQQFDPNSQNYYQGGGQDESQGQNQEQEKKAQQPGQ